MDSDSQALTALPPLQHNHARYDTLNRLSTLANSWAGSFGFSYDALSRRTQMTRPNGVATSYSYDNLSRLLSVLHQLSGSTIDGAAYTVDSAGNRTSKADEYANVTTNYGYDSIYELLQATQGSTTTESYSYDPVGNRLSSLGVSSYTNNSSNELTANSNVSYAYDYNGNTTSKTDSTGTTNYSWDYDNRLTSVTLPNSGGTVTFKYNPLGQRIYKQSPTATSIFLYDGDNLIETVNASGGEVAHYTQGQNIDEPLAMQRGTTTDYYEADGLGSITSLTGSNGSVAQSYTYDSFGNQAASSGSLTNFFRYTAREFDAEMGVYYNRARYYDPGTGRFLSEDPLRLGSSDFNFYRYVFNEPVVFRDPTGKTCECSYSISSGNFVCHGSDPDGGPISFSGKGYSGQPPYVNSPFYDNVPGGPIPVGRWTIGPGFNGPKGQPEFPLTPVDPGGWFPSQRNPAPGSFLIHADNPQHPGGSSEGCIVLPLPTRRNLKKCQGGTLQVTP